MSSEKDSQIKPKRILIVHNFYRLPGGEDSVVINEKRLLEEHGHFVETYFRSNSETEHYPMWLRCLLPFAMLFNWRTFFDIRNLIRQRHIDLVHVHNTLALISPSVYYAAKSCGIPVVQTVHNFRFLCPGALFYRQGKVCEECIRQGVFHSVRYKCYRDSRPATFLSALILKLHRKIYRNLFFICLTHFNREKLLLLNQQEKDQTIPSERVFIKPNFVSGIYDTAATPPSDIPKEPFLIFAARLTEEKGIHLLTEAWKIMGSKSPLLLLFGTGPEEQKLRDTIERQRITRIKFMGYRSNQDLRRILPYACALLLPSKWYEGFPMTMIESYKSGVPVIGSEEGNVGDIIRTYGGLTFDPNSADSLIQTLAKLQEQRPILHHKNMGPILSPNENYAILKNIYDTACSATMKLE